MDQQIIERAVMAAARAISPAIVRVIFRDEYEEDDYASGVLDSDDRVRIARMAVTAALAEVEASITAELESAYEALKPVNEYVTSKGYTTVAGGALMVRHEVGLVMRDLAWVAEERDDLAARIARVEALHVRTVFGYNANCEECGTYWPCPTIKAIRGESE